MVKRSTPLTKKKSVIYTLDALLAVLFSLIILFSAGSYLTRTNYNKFLLAQPYEAGADLAFVLDKTNVFNEFYLDNTWLFDGFALDTQGLINGTLSGNAHFQTNTDDYYDYYYVSDGNGDYINLGTGDEFDFAQDVDFSISMWIYKKGNSTSTLSGIAANGGGSNSDIGWAMRVDSDNDLHFYISDGTLRESITCSGAITSHQWDHVVGVWDRDGALTGYLNGASCDSNPDISDRNVDLSSTRTVAIGRWLANSQSFNGSINDVRIYNNTALDSSDVSTLYSGGSISETPTTHFSFDAITTALNSSIDEIKSTQYKVIFQLQNIESKIIANSALPTLDATRNFIASGNYVVAINYSHSITDFATAKYYVWVD